MKPGKPCSPSTHDKNMAQVTINGTIKKVGAVQDVSQKFRKREVVITEAGTQFPQDIPVEFTQDKCALLDGFQQGEEVSVMCYVNGREWIGKDGVAKYFLSLKGDRIERKGAPAMSNAGGYGGYQAAPPPKMSDMPPIGGDDDDLPF